MRVGAKLKSVNVLGQTGRRITERGKMSTKHGIETGRVAENYEEQLIIGLISLVNSRQLALASRNLFSSNFSHVFNLFYAQTFSVKNDSKGFSGAHHLNNERLMQRI